MQNYISITYDRKYICHHGIPGQKWGEKHGPPYPLDKEVSSKIKKGQDVKKFNMYGSWDAGSNKTMSPEELREKRDNSDLTKGIRVKIDANPEGTKVKELRYTYYPGYDPIMNPLELYDAKKSMDVSGPQSINDDASKVNRWSLRHPIGGGTYNCSNCAMAYELRRRGYDVVSRSEIDGSKMKDITEYFKNAKSINIDDTIKDDPIFNDPTFKKIFKKYDKLMANNRKSGKDPKDIKRLEWDLEDQRDAEIYSDENNERLANCFKRLNELTSKAMSKLQNTLYRMPNGSRGVITIGWAPDTEKKPSMFSGRTATSFHALNYEKSNGKLYIIDPQTNDYANVQVIKSSKDRFGFFPIIIDDYVDPRTVSYIPLESLEMNENKIVDAVINRSYKDW